MSWSITTGWDRAWVDVVTDRLVKMSDPKPDEQRVGQMVCVVLNTAAGSSYDTTRGKIQILLLKDLGIPTQSVCNMCAIAHEILMVPSQQAKTVVEYCKKRGVQGPLTRMRPVNVHDDPRIAGASLVTLLEAHPKLLTYQVDGERLSKGRTRAQVDVMNAASGEKKAVVSMWRDGAAFESPVAPIKPVGL